MDKSLITFIVIFVFSLIFIALACVIADVIILGKEFPNYKRFYTKLPDYTWYKYSDIVSNVSDTASEEVLWFTDTNDFKLGNSYLHNASFTRTSLYGMYWLRKYQRTKLCAAGPRG